MLPTSILPYAQRYMAHHERQTVVNAGESADLPMVRIRPVTTASPDAYDVPVSSPSTSAERW